MPDSFTDALSQHFGHAAFRPGQKEVIESILAGTRTLALFPTSAGKSLCYQLPARLLPGLTIVISPLLALMQDQVESLLQKGIAADRLDSTRSAEDTAAIFTNIEAGQLKLLYLSPERIAHRETLGRLKKATISLIAIDEAHCFSRWGQSFRPDYRRLPGVIRQLRPTNVLALTATASPAVAKDIRSGFRILARDQIRLPLTRENLSWHVTALPPQEKIAYLIDALHTRALPTPAIVYCTRQVTTVDVAAALQNAGLSARSFHAGIPTDARSEILADFMADKVDVIVATIAFGMGVDKANVRSVYHYEVPRSPEAWMQEAGRAGRDEAPSHTEVIAAENDFTAHVNITEASHPTDNAVERLLHRIFTGEKESLISPYQLTTDLDLSRQVLDTIIILLEIDKIIEQRAALHRKARVQTVRPVATILKSLTPADRRRVSRFLGIYGWQDLLAGEPSIGETVKTYLALRDLEQAGDLIIRWSHQLHVYRIAKPDSIDLSALKDRFCRHFDEVRDSELARLELVRKTLTSSRCIHKSLLNHLGEKHAADCGRCSRCVKAPFKRKLPAAKIPEISRDQLEQIHNLHSQGLGQLAAPAQLTRHLLGITSPASMAKRLYRSATHGLLAQHPWAEIHALATIVLRG